MGKTARSALLVVLFFCFVVFPASSEARSPLPMLKLEKEMLRLVNLDRAGENLPPLKWHRKSAEIARSHSRDMAVNDYFAHESPETGFAKERFFAGRVPTATLGENLALATSVVEAEDMLLKSAEHRANIMNADYTHIGIGIVRDGEGHLYVTQNFLIPIERVDLPLATRNWARKISDERVRQGLGSLRWHTQLTAAAQKHSKLMMKRGDMFQPNHKALAKLGIFRVVKSVVSIAPSLEALSEIDVVLEDRFHSIGVYAERNTREPEFYGFLYVTILLGGRQ